MSSRQDPVVVEVQGPLGDDLHVVVALYLGREVVGVVVGLSRDALDRPRGA